MNAKYILILAIILLASSEEQSYAADEAAAPLPARETNGQQPPASAEEPQSENLPRDPFWPIDYNPIDKEIETEKDEEEEQQQVDKTEQQKDLLRRQWDEAQAKINVSGLTNMGGGKRYAIINGEMLAKDDTVTISHANAFFTWKIENIDADGVKLERLRIRVRKN